MDKSESIKHLAAAMFKAQNEMSGVTKSKDNPFFKTKFADLKAVVQAVKEPFSNNGLSYVQFPIERGGRIGVETILMHESGEYLINEFTVQLTKQDAQGAGSAITYCRRYALQAIAGIPSEDDDGNGAQNNSKAASISNPVSTKTDDDKPWYTDQNYEFDVTQITSDIRNGKPPETIIKEISESFKIANKYREMIKSI